MLDRTAINNSLRYAAYASLLSVFVLLILSIVFYKERMFFIDPAFVVFRIVNTKAFVFAEYRYGAFITKMYPLIGAYLNLPLKWILVSYSASFYIFYLAVSLVISLRWKFYELSILFAMYFLLMVSDVFFWPNNEVHQGLGWLLLFIAFYFHSSEKKLLHQKWRHALLVFFLLAALSCHLLVFFPMLALWLMYHLEFESWKDNKLKKHLITYSALILVLGIVKYLLSAHGSYDAEKLSGVKVLSFSNALAAFSSGHSRSILQLILKNYWVLVPIVLVGFIQLARKKKWKQFVLILGLSITYYVLVCITFPNAFDRNLQFYMESEWQAFSFIVAIPFVYDWLSSITMKYLPLLAVVFIFTIRFAYIGSSYELFHERYQKLKSITISLNEAGVKKAFVNRTEQSKKDLIMDWGTPQESLLLSSLLNLEEQSTFNMITLGEPNENSSTWMLSSFKSTEIEEMNRNYFKLDTLNHYNVVSYPDTY